MFGCVAVKWMEQDAVLKSCAQSHKLFQIFE